MEGLTSEVANVSIKRFGATKTNNGISALIQLENQSNNEQITELSIANEQKDL